MHEDVVSYQFLVLNQHFRRRAAGNKPKNLLSDEKNI